jgi:hypothetical protein
MTSRLVSFALACVLLAICSARAAPGLLPAGWLAQAPEPPRPASDVPLVLVGGERLVWDQGAPSAAAVRRYTFRLYVNGDSAGLADARCGDPRTSAGYECSGLLPRLNAGRHVLELTTVDEGRESSRSAGLVVTVPDAGAVAAETSTGQSWAAASDQARGALCLDAANAECYETRLIAAGGQPVSALVSTADNRILFVEGERVVRVIENDHLLRQPALVHDDRPGARLVSLAVAPDFERSRLVYVGSIEPSRSGARELRVTRYREVAGVLGQGATVVTGLPIPSDGFVAPIAVDDEGLLYVALPGADVGTRETAAFARSILRFNPDGSVARGNPTPSPVLARGYARPASLLWDPVYRQLWLSGMDAGLRPVVSVLPLAAQQGMPWPWATRAVVLQGAGPQLAGPPHIVFSGAGTSAHPRRLWALPEQGVVRRTFLQRDHDTLRLDEVSFGRLGNIRWIADGSGGTLLAVSEIAPTPGRVLQQMWRLTPLPSSR